MLCKLDSVDNCGKTKRLFHRGNVGNALKLFQDSHLDANICPGLVAFAHESFQLYTCPHCRLAIFTLFGRVRASTPIQRRDRRTRDGRSVAEIADRTGEHHAALAAERRMNAGFAPLQCDVEGAPRTGEDPGRVTG